VVGLRRLALLAAAVVPAPARDIRLHAEDGLDAVLLGRFVEMNEPEETAVVGQRERGHVEFARAADEVFDLDRPVEQAELGMRMQMDERCRHG
jgi:hypothetical protein